MGILSQPLVFVDIETNALSPTAGRVIEVAAIRVEHDEVVQTFDKLIDPGSELPYFTTQLTGITDDDLRSAPAFNNIAQELYAVMDGAVFVAHNVNFDYSFLREEFARVGITFAPSKMCTVKLSRALYPEHKSHKLANLIERHGFTYKARHRAYDDAHVLWQFLQHAQETFATETLHAAIAKQIA